MTHRCFVIGSVGAVTQEDGDVCLSRPPLFTTCSEAQPTANQPSYIFTHAKFEADSFERAMDMAIKAMDGDMRFVREATSVSCRPTWRLATKREISAAWARVLLGPSTEGGG